MDDLKFQKKLTAAMAEPAAPSELTDNTVKRVQTILRGREAEKRLAGSESLNAGEKAELAADGLLGRLAGKGKLPLGANTAAYREQLVQDERFQKLAQQPGRSLAGGLENGEFVKSLTRKPAKTPSPAKKPPSLGR